MRPGRDLAAFALLTLLWGSTFVFMKIGLAYWPPVLYAAGRNLLGFAVLLAVARALRSPLARDWPGWWPQLVYGVLNGTGFAVMFWAIQYLDTGVAAVILGSLPMFTLLLGRIWPGTRVAPVQFLGVCLGLIGLGILVGSQGIAHAVAGPMGRVAAIVLVADAVWYAVGYLFAKEYFRSDAMSHSLGYLGSSGIYLVLLSLVFDPRPTQAIFLWPSIGSWLYVGVLGSGVAYYLIFYLLESAGPVVTTYVNVVSPALAVVIGVLFLGETWSLPGLFGVAAILVGTWLVVRRLAPGTSPPQARAGSHRPSAGGRRAG